MKKLHVVGGHHLRERVTNSAKDCARRTDLLMQFNIINVAILTSFL